MIWLFAKRHKDVHLGKIKWKEKFLDIKAEATHLSSIIKYEFINKDESHLVTHNRVNNLYCLLNFEYVTFYVSRAHYQNMYLPLQVDSIGRRPETYYKVSLSLKSGLAFTVH